MSLSDYNSVSRFEEYSQLDSILQSIIDSNLSKDRSLRFTKYKSCFSGKEVVDLVVSTKHASNLEEALQLIQRMFDIQLLVCISSPLIPFRSDSNLYAIKPIEQPSQLDSLSIPPDDPIIQTKQVLTRHGDVCTAGDLICVGLYRLNRVSVLLFHKERLLLLFRPRGSSNSNSSSSNSGVEDELYGECRGSWKLKNWRCLLSSDGQYIKLYEKGTREKHHTAIVFKFAANNKNQWKEKNQWLKAFEICGVKLKIETLHAPGQTPTISAVGTSLTANTSSGGSSSGGGGSSSGGSSGSTASGHRTNGHGNGLKHWTMMPDDLNEDGTSLALTDVMAIPAYEQVFREFLKKNFCSESFSFIQAATAFRLSTDTEQLAQLAVTILDTFVKPSARSYVNIDSRTQQLITGRVEKQQWSQQMFIEAELAVRHMVTNDVFRRFTSSTECKHMIEVAQGKDYFETIEEATAAATAVGAVNTSSTTSTSTSSHPSSSSSDDLKTPSKSHTAHTINASSVTSRTVNRRRRSFDLIAMEDEYSFLYEIQHKIRQSVLIKQESFSGAVLLDWMIESGHAKRRLNALTICQRLLDGRFLCTADSSAVVEGAFKDDPKQKYKLKENNGLTMEQREGMVRESSESNGTKLCGSILARGVKYHRLFACVATELQLMYIYRNPRDLIQQPYAKLGMKKNTDTAFTPTSSRIGSSLNSPATAGVTAGGGGVGGTAGGGGGAAGQTSQARSAASTVKPVYHTSSKFNLLSPDGKGNSSSSGASSSMPSPRRELTNRSCGDASSTSDESLDREGVIKSLESGLKLCVHWSSNALDMYVPSTPPVDAGGSDRFVLVTYKQDDTALGSIVWTPNHSINNIQTNIPSDRSSINNTTYTNTAPPTTTATTTTNNSNNNNTIIRFNSDPAVVSIITDLTTDSNDAIHHLSSPSSPLSPPLVFCPPKFHESSDGGDDDDGGGSGSGSGSGSSTPSPPSSDSSSPSPSPSPLPITSLALHKVQAIQYNSLLITDTTNHHKSIRMLDEEQTVNFASLILRDGSVLHVEIAPIRFTTTAAAAIGSGTASGSTPVSPLSPQLSAGQLLKQWLTKIHRLMQSDNTTSSNTNSAPLAAAASNSSSSPPGSSPTNQMARAKRLSITTASVDPPTTTTPADGIRLTHSMSIAPVKRNSIHQRTQSALPDSTKGNSSSSSTESKVSSIEPYTAKLPTPNSSRSSLFNRQLSSVKGAHAAPTQPSSTSTTIPNRDIHPFSTPQFNTLTPLFILDLRYASGALYDLIEHDIYIAYIYIDVAHPSKKSYLFRCDSAYHTKQWIAALERAGVKIKIATESNTINADGGANDSTGWLDRKVQVYLGGSVSPIVKWRNDVAIPLLTKAKLTYYDPQQAFLSRTHTNGNHSTSTSTSNSHSNPISQALLDTDSRYKKSSLVLLFVIDSLTRAIPTMIEVAERAAQKRYCVVVVQDVVAGQKIGEKGEIVGEEEAEDLNAGRERIRSVCREYTEYVLIAENIEKAIQHIIDAINSNAYDTTSSHCSLM